MKLFSALAAASALVLAQDAGVGASPDAGVAVKAIPVLQAPDAATTAELAALRAELKTSKAQTEALTERLDAAIAELKALRSELAERKEADAQRVKRSEASNEAAVTLGALDAQLATGNASVESALSGLESSLGPSARTNVELARAALRNNDLATARVYLWQASVEAQAGR
jgi:Skp family chaperone for outer membrane proteins